MLYTRIVRELDLYLQASHGPVWCEPTPGKIDLTSQIWRGIPWRHTITLNGAPAKTAILLVTGGDPNDLDEEESRGLAAASGLPVANLYHVPNQPLFEDLWEDDLIAFTFIQHLASGEGDWPLLLPMVQSVVAAMDALEALHGIEKFIVTGISKRGWTTWLAAATGDPRILGIAPMSIDHLNVPFQMAHQLATWGEYSESIRAYTELDLPKKLDSPEGLHLNSIVDPYAYIDRYRCPILVVTGTNDTYWQVDALGNYWNDLPPSKWARTIPNSGHVPDHSEKNATLAAFARKVSRGESVFTPNHEFVRDGERVTLLSQPSDAQRLALWGARSTNYEFRDKEWTVLDEGGVAVQATLESPYTALLGEWEFRQNGQPYRITTPVKVLGPSSR